jgi:molybdate/tungstate transport system substrate-binding protein
MYPTTVPGSSRPFAGWTIKFASNRLGFAYRPDSIYASEINAGNWFEVLARDDVRLGMADPRLDAAGYRSLMMCQLAELHYGAESVFEDVISRNLSGPVRVAERDGEYHISVPEIIESRRNNFYLRGFTVQLLNLLEAGQLDYAFMYKSLAIQHGLEFLELPREVDMSSMELAEWYAQVVVELDFQRFKSVTPVFGGEPIIYGLTIPANAHHSAEAELFIQFLLGPEGSSIMGANYQPVISPSADNPAAVPQSLKALLE